MEIHKIASTATEKSLALSFAGFDVCVCECVEVCGVCGGAGAAVKAQ